MFFLLQAALLPFTINPFLKNYLSLSLSTAASVTSPPSVPSSVFLPRHPSRLLVLFSFALLSRCYLSFFCLAPPPRPDLSPNRFSSFSFHLHFSLDHFISLPVFPAALSHLPAPLAASCHFYFCLPNFRGQNVKFTRGSLALSLLYSDFFCSSLRPNAYIWEKKDGELPQLAKVEGAYLRFEMLNKSDNGVYLCQADNGIGNSQGEYTLLVQGKEHWGGALGQNEGCVVVKM